jgi:hypothetical protein
MVFLAATIPNDIYNLYNDSFKPLPVNFLMMINQRKDGVNHECK